MQEIHLSQTRILKPVREDLLDFESKTARTLISLIFNIHKLLGPIYIYLEITIYYY